MHNGCDHCLWADQCSDERECEHFTPLNEELYIDEWIERNRMTYRSEWFEQFGEEEGDVLWLNS